MKSKLLVEKWRKVSEALNHEMAKGQWLQDTKNEYHFQLKKKRKKRK